MRVPKDPDLHNCHILNALQFGPPSKRSVPAWSCSFPRGLHVLAVGGWAANHVATAGFGAAEPAGSSGSMASCANIKR